MFYKKRLLITHMTTLLTMSLFLVSQSNAITCTNILRTEPLVPGVFFIAGSFPTTTDWSRWRGTLSRSRFSPGVDLYTHWFKEDGEFSATTLFLLEHQRPKRFLHGTTSRLSSQLFLSAKERATHFVVTEYQSRRSHWPHSFIAKLKETADEYELQSTYIIIEGNNWGAYPNKPMDRYNPGHTVGNGYINPDMMGTMRLIHEKEGAIPLEHYLGITIKNPEGTIKVEPGNFAIVNEANSISIIAIGIQMLAQASRYQREFGKTPYFVTFADSFSEKLYGAMGFKPLTGAQVHSDQYPASDKIEVVRDGITWVPMYASVDMMSRLLNRKLELQAKRTHRGEPERAQNLYDDFKSIVDRSSSQLSTFDTSVDSYLGTVRNQLGLKNEKSGRLILERFGSSTKLYLSLDRELQHTSLTRHMAREPIEINTPLTEGLRVVLDHGSILTYSGGVLTLRGDQNGFVMKVWVDSQLSQPQKAEYYETSDGETIEHYFQIEF